MDPPARDFIRDILWVSGAKRDQISVQAAVDLVRPDLLGHISTITEKLDEWKDLNLICFPSTVIPRLSRLKEALLSFPSEEKLEIPDVRSQREEFHNLLQNLWKIFGGIRKVLSSVSSNQWDREDMLDHIDSIHDKLFVFDDISGLLETVAKEIKAATSDEEKSKEELPYSSSTSRVASTQIITTPQIGHKFNLLPESIKRCFYYSCLFPKRYEFEEEKLIQLWIAGDLVLLYGKLKKQLEDEGRGMKLFRNSLFQRLSVVYPNGIPRYRVSEQLEDEGRDIFEKLLWNSLFQRSSVVYPNGIPRYKVPDDVYDLVQQSCPDVFVTTADREPTATTLHSLLLLHHSNDTAIFKSLYESEMLRTLILLNEENHRSRIRQVPPDLFLRLRFLRAVDLSGTCIMELPTSIKNLKHLAFLDLSYTPITILPDSICSSLNHLLTLNLRNCSELIELPNSLSEMMSLRHLDLEGARQLTSMPPSIGKLTNLRKLGTFVVGREEGCRIEELRNLNELRGSLAILNLENVMDGDKAERVRLQDKWFLTKLEFQWSGVEWGRKAENVLNNLRPPSQVRELKILHYGGSTFPEWLSISNLTTIILIGCGGCTHLPSLGKLPNLTSLCIEEMHALKETNNYGLRKFGIPEFPRLMKLELDGMHELRKWWEIEVGDMPRLHKLTITDCPKLTTLPMLEWLPSLRHLEVTLCPKISSLPDGAPPNLRSLIIAESPKLEKRCRKGKGEDWHKIARVPDIWIHYKQISGIKTEHSQANSASDVIAAFYLLPEHLRRCFLHACFLFPTDEKFDKNTLIQLWMAVDMVLPQDGLRLEGIADNYFQHLLSCSLFEEEPIYSAHKWSSSSLTRYFTNKDVCDLVRVEHCGDEYARVDDRRSRFNVPAGTFHCSASFFKPFPEPNPKLLYKAKMLRTLQLRVYHSGIWLDLDDLFHKLRFLRALDLRSVNIRMLSDSIDLLDELRYLDLSNSCIQKLPESMCTLRNLRALKLRNCRNLIGLPNDTSKLISLQHLELQCEFSYIISPSIGKLTNLRTLDRFFLERGKGFGIGELEDLNELEGSLTIENLQNVLDGSEAKQARLEEKQLSILKLKWNGRAHNAEEVLACLKPHKNLRVLNITNYGGAKFPSWLWSSSFSNLTTIILFSFHYCIDLPPLGLLPSLKYLFIEQINAMERIDQRELCGDGTAGSAQTFPSLETLEISFMGMLKEWTGIAAGDMPCLRYLKVKYCPKLTSLPVLSCLKSLRHLELTHCRKISSLPEKGLPNLLSLSIRNCPELEIQCQEGRGKDWDKITGIPIIRINDKRIFGTGKREQSTGMTVKLSSFYSDSQKQSAVSIHSSLARLGRV